MNQKTAKLISRYCEESGRHYRDAKKRWNTLDPKERTKRRALLKDYVANAKARKKGA